MTPAPLVGVVMGSRSDWEVMRHAAEMLTQLGVPHECEVVSAHRTPEKLMQYASEAAGRGLEVIIAGAGGAAHLPGMCAAKTHLPVLIYPNPFARVASGGYVVINSGHTFREADLKGTNALLYPRLGDWAVLKPKPTKDDPAGFEVIDAGLFDENWQFPKAK